MKNIFVVLLTIFMVVVYGAGSYLTKATLTDTTEIPSSLNNIRAVHFPSKSGSVLSGWLLEAKQGKGGILLLHGVKSNRLQMLNRAKFLQKAGYDVLLFDFQAHGESQGEQITFGHLESLDANSAYEYLADRVCNPSIGVIGVSLGGASVLLGDVAKKAKVLILEAVYPTIEEAINDRFKIYFGSFGSYLTPLLTLQIEPRLGIDINDLRPIDYVHTIKGAVMFVIGSKDKHTTVLETKQMFLQAKEPKELWIINGAGHANFDKFLGEKYNQKILHFLKKWMD